MKKKDTDGDYRLPGGEDWAISIPYGEIEKDGYVTVKAMFHADITEDAANDLIVGVVRSIMAELPVMKNL